MALRCVAAARGCRCGRSCCGGRTAPRSPSARARPPAPRPVAACFAAGAGGATGAAAFGRAGAAVARFCASAYFASRMARRLSILLIVALTRLNLRARTDNDGHRLQSIASWTACSRAPRTGSCCATHAIRPRRCSSKAGTSSRFWVLGPWRWQLCRIARSRSTSCAGHLRPFVDDQPAEGLPTGARHHPGLAGVEPEALVARRSPRPRRSGATCPCPSRARPRTPGRRRTSCSARPTTGPAR